MLIPIYPWDHENTKYNGRLEYLLVPTPHTQRKWHLLELSNNSKKDYKNGFQCTSLGNLSLKKE